MVEIPREIFQSTLPVWGATCAIIINRPLCTISIHAPRVGSDTAGLLPHLFLLISIHAPRVGSDGAWASNCLGGKYFNPRSPCGERRTGGRACFSLLKHFNPRSPCGERPYVVLFTIVIPSDFNPRSPCGERLRPLPGGVPWELFQSTLPVWGATSCTCQAVQHQQEISIHAPRVGSDVGLFNMVGRASQFQSTLPVWGATIICTILYSLIIISIHAPRVGSDFTTARQWAAPVGFQSTLPVWGATPPSFVYLLQG